MFDGVKNYLSETATEPVVEKQEQEVENKTTETVDVEENNVETVDETKETETVEEKEETKETVDDTSEKDNTETEEDVVETPEPKQISDDDFIEYARKKYGFEGDNLDSFFKPKEETDPFDGYSDEVKEFLKFSKETNGRGIDDWVSLQKDYTKSSPLEIAREKAIRESDGALTHEDVDQYLEKKLNIDLSDESEIDKFDLIDVKNYGKDYLQAKIAEQEKYRTPLEKKQAEAQVQKYKLDDGREVTQEEYQQILDNNKKEYIKTIKASSDNIKDVGFEIPFDVNGEKKAIKVKYDYSQDDKHKMVSDASDIDNFFAKNFRNKDGSIKAKELQEAMWRMDENNFKKVVMDAAQKMSAEVIELNLQKENNFKFPTDRIPKKDTAQKVEPLPGTYMPSVSKFL